MSKQIKLNYDNKEYILEYNRKAVSDIETLGFSMSELRNKPATMIPLMVQGAFLMHHAKIRMDEVTEIYNSINDKSKFINAISDMINDCYQSLLSEDSENKDNGKNVSWEIM
ncbi:MAG TPA: DUF5055 domain-containing protein [Candidatus Onthocola stercoravium]|nr:DUF5055 domain-containing protein [Candidatus Onthocola stercoravium]